MTRRLLVLLVALTLVAAACGDDSTTETTAGGGTTETTAGGGTTDTTAGGSTGQGGGTLAEVKARGVLNCGVSEGAAGFTNIDGSDFSGIDVDYCRAVAAAIFGDANKVEFFPVSSQVRFDNLKAGQYDVLFRNTTWTASRDTDVGMNFGPTTYFDGQGVMGPKSKGFTADSGPEDVDGLLLCTSAGTTSEKNVAEWASLGGASIRLETLETNEDVYSAMIDGSCDMATTDASNLVGERFTRGFLDEWVIFPPSNISKEPLGPAYREGDDEWADIIDWTVYVTFIAAEKGVTSATIDAAIASGDDPELLRIAGQESSEIVADLGIQTDGFLQVIKQIGNYNEIYERNLAPLGLTQAGSLNALWTEGGLIYAPPFR
jgi:general L-amino acid transport system substrate-binding protein